PVRGVDLEALRASVARLAAIIAPRAPAAQRVGERLVREREHAFRIEMVLSVPLGAAGLAVAVVDLIAAAAAGVAEDAVEHALPLLVFVEAEEHEVVQRARGLRYRVAVGVLHVA